MSVPWVLLPMSIRIPRKEAPPNRAPTKKDTPFPEPSNYLLKFPVNGLPRFPNRPLQRERERERDTCLHSFFVHLSPKVPSKWAPISVPQQGPYGERSFISRANSLFIRLCLSESPEEPSHEKRGKHLVTVHGAPKAYIQWGAAWFPKGIPRQYKIR